MRTILDFIFVIYSLFYLVLMLVKRKSIVGLRKRLFINTDEIKGAIGGNRPIWLHAVSVGETISILGFVNLLQEKFPQEKIIISTVTAAANDIARKIFPGNVSVIYLPLDLSFVVRRCVSNISPKLFILTETEIWPNLILELKRQNIPVGVINGRISARSFKRYKTASFLFKPIFSRMDFFGMKTEEDALRIISLGARTEKVKVTGSTKFDLALSYEVKEEQQEELRQKLCISDEEIVLLCGSTHKPEEKIIIQIYLELKKKYDNLKLIVAPRHTDRTQEIKKLCKGFGLKFRLFSSLSKKHPADEKVIIVDEIGVLRQLYSVCSLAFIGGSLIKRGGHNMLEPASFKKAVIFGKWIYNFAVEANLLCQAGAAVMVEGKEELKQVIEKLFADTEKLENMGKAARISLGRNSGATCRDLECLSRFV